jgi:hypothetical protein
MHLRPIRYVHRAYGWRSTGDRAAPVPSRRSGRRKAATRPLRRPGLSAWTTYCPGGASGNVTWPAPSLTALASTVLSLTERSSTSTPEQAHRPVEHCQPHGYAARVGRLLRAWCIFLSSAGHNRNQAHRRQPYERKGHDGAHIPMPGAIVESCQCVPSLGVPPQSRDRARSVGDVRSDGYMLKHDPCEVLCEADRRAT